MIPRPVGPLPLEVPIPGSSFSDLLQAIGGGPALSVPEGATVPAVPEGTTVLALRYQGGVVMAGDRTATEGNLVAHRTIRKVFPADRYSAVAIAGVAGLAMDMVKLFQVELEHYEKLEGVRLSLEGKASFLARLVKSQLPMALRGLVVVPLFAGFDAKDAVGKVYSYDVVGGRYLEIDFGSTGSGSRLAKAYLRTQYEPEVDAEEALALAVRALVSAAREDTATGGPDLDRGIYPTVVRIDSEGLVELDDETIAPIAEEAVETVR